MRFTAILLSLLYLAGGGLVACWDDAEQIDQVVWSSDDSRQAYVKLLFEENSHSSPLSGTTNKRNFRHRIYVQNADGSFRALTGERSHQNGATFFFMREAGYAMIEVIESGQTSRFDLIRLDGGASHTVARFTRPSGPAIPCHHMQALPSPNGALIAIIERGPEGGGTSREACENGDTSVTFIDAATLETVASHTWEMHAMPEAYWTDEQELFIWGYLDGSWRVDPAHGPIEQAHPFCTWPATSSSALSGGGVMIGPGENDANPIIVVNDEHENCRRPE